jgi:hypothetical protein
MRGARVACAAIFLAVAVAVAVAAPATASPRVNVMVVGKTRTFFTAHSVLAGRSSVVVGRHRCGVAAATPLSALLAARRAHAPAFHVSDYGSCTSHTTESDGLFVDRVSHDRNRGRDGWYYKVGHKAGTSGAASPSGPFGDGRRLRSGQRVAWFYCHFSGNSCQRTLEVALSTAHPAPGEKVRVTVRGYDDFGHGRKIGGVAVRLGESSATTAADGTAELLPPAKPGLYSVTAQKHGAVPAFPEAVRVR